MNNICFGLKGQEKVCLRDINIEFIHSKLLSHWLHKFPPKQFKHWGT